MNYKLNVLTVNINQYFILIKLCEYKNIVSFGVNFTPNICNKPFFPQRSFWLKWKNQTKHRYILFIIINVFYTREKMRIPLSNTPNNKFQHPKKRVWEHNRRSFRGDVYNIIEFMHTYLVLNIRAYYCVKLE